MNNLSNIITKENNTEKKHIGVLIHIIREKINMIQRHSKDLIHPGCYNDPDER